jgi:uncharacterized protein YdeI (YjbR/CyaY-like superfamily)
MTERKGLPVFAFATRQAWENWLAKNEAALPGLWLKFAKKSSGAASVGKPEAIEVALAYGWIDGQQAPFDENHWLVRFTPRRPKSKWSQINRSAAEKLSAAGKMKPAGLAEVEKAKADGRWEVAYPPQSTIEVPADLQAALDANLAACAFFLTLKGANRYAVLYRIHDAKSEKIRAARIEKFVAMLARQEVLHPKKA